MADFRDNPWLGEALHLARENGVLISLICHAPVALTSTRLRVDSHGRAYRPAGSPFGGATITVAGKRGEKLGLRFSYVHIPWQRTMLTHFADDALTEAGFKVEGGLNPSGVKLAYEPAAGLLTGNGPQSIDAQARKIRSILAARPAPDDTRPARPAANTSA